MTINSTPDPDPDPDPGPDPHPHLPVHPQLPPVQTPVPALTQPAWPAKPTQTITIRPLGADDHALDQLAALLEAVVADGGSVGFMHPVAPAAARAFWPGSLAAAARGERVVLGAFDGAALLGTVTLLLAFPPNQPQRAEIAKMMTHPAARNRGVAGTLLRAAEALAVQHAKTLLLLDTASDGGAARLYEAHGFTLAGMVPDFALTPHGKLTGTLFYWKRIGAGATS